MRTIRVTGKGSVKTAPDQYRISYRISSRAKDAEDSSNLAAKNYNLILTELIRLGFEQKDVKTTQYQITTYEEKEYMKAHDRYVVRESGYECNWNGYFEWDMIKLKLGEVIRAITASKADCQFKIFYKIKDPTAVGKELLEKCVADSQMKAKILAVAAGCQLGSIQSIDYSYGEILIHDTEDCDMDCRSMAMPMSDVEMNPEDIENSDTVSIEWELE